MQKPYSVTSLEQRFLETTQFLHEYLITFYSLFSTVFDSFKTTTIYLWQFEEFRLGIYVFGILACIPILLFLILSILVILITTVILSVVGAAIILTILGLAFLFLIAVMVTCLLAAIFVSSIYFLSHPIRNNFLTKDQEEHFGKLNKTE
ncbi:hypothetical protein BY458DRAFT_512977 [Sporodiniella umbellata]|nr:hypothetical protein BY458DRAFT_512977 [Sporodiniella umbellata]